MTFTHPMTTPEEVLAHHGTKGMKWGVRKEKQLQAYSAVARGEATARQTLKVYANTPLYMHALPGGRKRFATNVAADLQAQKTRIELGKATIRDKLDRALNTSMIDLARGR